MITAPENPFLRGLTAKKPGDKKFLDALVAVSTPQERAPRNLPLRSDQVERLGKGRYDTDQPNRQQRKARARALKAQQAEYQRKFGARDARRQAELKAIEEEHYSQYNVNRRYAGFWHALRRSTNPRGSQAVNYLLR